MSIHINADPNAIADTVLLPGDPLRAKFIAENILSNSVQYNSVRGMLGYTGYHNDKKVSVQGSGMGLPSLSIYVHELINEYNVKNIIRIGSCGSFQQHIKVRDLVLAMSSSTDSSMNRIKFGNRDFAPCADFGLLFKAFNKANEMGVSVHVGGILATDSFYQDDTESWKLWASYNVLAVEMESSALYTICAKYGTKALSILTVSDSLTDGSTTDSTEREQTFLEMVNIALGIL